MQILAVVFVLVVAGLMAQMSHLASSVPGAGWTGRVDAEAVVSAQRAEAFAAACLRTAAATPGLVAADIAVTIPAAPGAVIALPTGARCATAPAGGTARYVLAHVPLRPGMLDQLRANSHGGEGWYSVTDSGAALPLSGTASVSLPLSVPAPAALRWVQVGS